jgi:RAD50-interacting protein 1
LNRDEANLEGSDIALPQTLLAPVALLNSHLAFLRAIIPQNILTIIYRKIAFRLAEHIFQRQVMFRGHFDQNEGRRIFTEAELWIESCSSALSGGLGGGRSRVEAPWRKLYQTGLLVGAQGEAWVEIVDLTFGFTNDEDWENALANLVGSVEMQRDEAMAILRRRNDCSR